jgi:ABC-type transport system involved in multi-copper enzyme maturation permease subunit
VAWGQPIGEEVPVLIFHSFTLLTIYSIAFLLGCLVREAAKAAVLAIMATLLLYFLPVLVPPLQPLSIFAPNSGWERCACHNR